MLRPSDGAVEEEDCVACVAEGGFQDAGGVVEEAEDADDRSGIDGFTESFVVKADVAAGDGSAKRGAGCSYAVDGLGELPHDFGFFGATEIQTVCCGDRASTAGSDVAGGLGYGVHGAEFRIELAPTAIAVGRERQCLHDTVFLGFLDAN